MFEFSKVIWDFEYSEAKIFDSQLKYRVRFGVDRGGAKYMRKIMNQLANGALILIQRTVYIGRIASRVYDDDMPRTESNIDRGINNYSFDLHVFSITFEANVGLQTWFVSRATFEVRGRLKSDLIISAR